LFEQIDAAIDFTAQSGKQILHCLFEGLKLCPEVRMIRRETRAAS
jgi:hypothetical protein